MRQKTDNLVYGVDRQLIVGCLEKLGKDFDKCEMCGQKLTKFCLHHDKYEGATIYDLMIVCNSCNQKADNKNRS